MGASATRTGDARPTRRSPAAPGAAAWALAFAAMSFYWALGGAVGLATLDAETATWSSTR